MSDLPKVAPLLWVLWHHLGADSTVGQPIREYLGIGRSDLLTDGQTKVAQEYGIRRASGNGDQILEAPAYARVACHDEELLRRLERLEAQLAMHARVFDAQLLETALRDRPQPQPDHIPDARKMVDTGWRNLHDLSPIYEPAPPEPEQPRAGLLDGLVNPDCAPDAVEQVLARVLRHMAEREASRGPAPPEPAPAVELVERVAEAMERHHVTGAIEGSWDAQARAAIREIAAATDQMAPDRNLTWERVALWLEREASR